MRNILWLLAPISLVGLVSCGGGSSSSSTTPVATADTPALLAAGLNRFQKYGTTAATYINLVNSNGKDYIVTSDKAYTSSPSEFGAPTTSNNPSTFTWVNEGETSWSTTDNSNSNYGKVTINADKTLTSESGETISAEVKDLSGLLVKDYAPASSQLGVTDTFTYNQTTVFSAGAKQVKLHTTLSKPRYALWGTFNGDSLASIQTSLSNGNSVNFWWGAPFGNWKQYTATAVSGDLNSGVLKIVDSNATEIGNATYAKETVAGKEVMLITLPAAIQVERRTLMLGNVNGVAYFGTKHSAGETNAFEPIALLNDAALANVATAIAP